MLSSRFIFIAAAVAVVTSAQAASLEEVVVTATRSPTPVDQVLAPVDIITREDLSLSLSPDVADLLRTQPGVEISRNGGIGQNVSVFIRGANSNQTLVLLDGVRMNPGTIGTASLQNIPPQTIERIEIVKGPLSTLYGSDAIGGVINIITRQPTTPGVSGEAQAGYGSYDTRQASGYIDDNGSFGNAGANVSWLKSAGFPTLNASTIDNGYSNLTLGAHAGTDFGPVHATARIYQDKGNTAYLNFAPDAPVDQDYLDRVTRTDFSLHANSIWDTRLVLSRMDNSIQQREAVSFIPGEFDYLQTRRYAADWQNDLQLDANDRLTAGATYSKENARALSYGTLFDTDTNIFNAYVQDQFTYGPHALLLAAGYTDYSTFGSHVTWNADYGYSITDSTRVSASAGTGFRAPNATDLYGFGGNPDLKPEKSTNIELDVRQRLSKQQTATLSVFQNDLNDMIQYNGALNLVQNIASARIRGAELSYDYRTDDWHIRAAANYQDPRDRITGQLLLRRAEHTFTAGYSQRLGLLEIGADMLISGPRQDSQFPGTIELGSYVLANINARYSFSDNFSLIAQIENVLNEHYQIATGYNVAGRGGSIALRYGTK